VGAQIINEGGGGYFSGQTARPTDSSVKLSCCMSWRWFISYSHDTEKDKENVGIAGMLLS
jgi:hypothetical protein